MNNNVDLDALLSKSLKPDIAPADELNKKILEQASDEKKTNNIRAFTPVNRLAKVASVVLAVFMLGSLGTYAATKLLRPVETTPDAVYVGNLDNTMGEIEESGETVSVQTQNFETYREAVESTGLDNWFSTEYETIGTMLVMYLGMDTLPEININGSFKYNEGAFYVYQSMIEAQYRDPEMTFMVPVENPVNERYYTNSAGIDFTLEDGGENGIINTYVIVSYDDYFGYLMFNSLSDDEICEILETVVPN